MAALSSVVVTLESLYASEINFSLSCFWDGKFDWKLGDPWNGFPAEGNAQTVEEAVRQLASAARRAFPDSEFAKRNLADDR